MRKRRTWEIGFLLPSAVGLIVFYVLPLLRGLPYAVWSPGQGWLGFSAIRAVVTSEVFRLGVKNSAVLMGLCVPLTLGLALAIAFWLHRTQHAAKWLQSAVFLPYVLPTVSALFAFCWLLDYNGIVNRALSWVWIDRIAWLTGDELLWSVVLLFLWKNTGFFTALFTTRLLSTPQDLLENAKMDGAGWLAQGTAVYLPHLAPTLLFAAVLCAVQACDIFRECWLLAGSYPSPNVYTLQHYLYNRFHAGDYTGAASALYVLLPVLAGLTWALLKGEKRAET